MITRLFVALSLSLSLASCSILPSGKPVSTYRLPPSSLNLKLNTQAGSLIVATPYANRFLNSQRLMVVRPSGVIEAYAGVRWDDLLPNIFRDRLVDDMRRSQAYRLVNNDTQTLKATRLLRTDILAYQLNLDGSKQSVVIQLNANLIDNQTMQAIASQRFSVSENVDDLDMDTVMPVFAKLNDAINQQIIEWVVKQ